MGTEIAFLSVKAFGVTGGLLGILIFAMAWLLVVTDETL